MELNWKIGKAASYILAGTIAVFFLSMAVGLTGLAPSGACEYISYLVCIVLSWSYLAVTACSAQNCTPERRGAAEAAKLFAVLYAVFINLVYFTQLTAVYRGIVPDGLRQLFDFQYLGSWMFSLDIIGYGIMAVSTFFLGLSRMPAGRKDLLKTLLMVHGVFVVAIPITLFPVFTNNRAGSLTGTLLLMAWCVYFFLVSVLFIRNFLPAKSKSGDFSEFPENA